VANKKITFKSCSPIYRHCEPARIKAGKAWLKQFRHAYVIAGHLRRGNLEVRMKAVLN
jgi:hypothetical protein